MEWRPTVDDFRNWAMLAANTTGALSQVGRRWFSLSSL